MNLLNGHIRQGWDEINVYGLILRMSEFHAEPNNYLSKYLPVGRYLYLGCWIVLKVDFQASKGTWRKSSRSKFSMCNEWTTDLLGPSYLSRHQVVGS